MDMKQIKGVWAAYLEVQEAKHKKNEKMDPVGQEDGDIDNDGDKDSSDEYLKNRRKAISKDMKKEGKIPPQFLKNVKKKKGDDDEEEKDDVKEGEESPYPSLDKKKREKKGSNLDDAGGPAAKLKGESVEEAIKGKGPISTAIKTAKGAVNTISSTAKTLNMGAEDGEKVECPKCKGKGCDHCDDKGYHMKESFEYFVENLSDEELEDYIEWLNEEEELDELSTGMLQRYSNKASKSIDRHDDMEVNSKPGSRERKYHARKLSNRIRGKDRADQKVFDRKNPVESVDRMDIYVEALRNMPNDQIDELSGALKLRAADAADKKAKHHTNKLMKHGNRLSTSNNASNASKIRAKMDKHYNASNKAKNQANTFRAGAERDMKRRANEAFDIIDQVVESRIRSRLENLLSPWELEAIEEKAKHVGTKGPEPAPQEEFMSTSSPNDKKQFAAHKAGSDKKLEDYEDMSEKDGVKAGRAVKSQSPTRRGEKRIGDIAMPKPTKAKGQ